MKGGIYFMEVYERIKELRKKHFKMSQETFAERLGVSRSVIKNIELNALARPEQKMPLYKLICTEFNVNEKWLLTGEGDMFSLELDENTMLVEQILNDVESPFKSLIFDIMKIYNSLDQTSKIVINNFIEQLKNEQNNKKSENDN
jgi:transcriptional regulator with XRE-family HTH domain